MGRTPQTSGCAVCKGKTIFIFPHMVENEIAVSEASLRLLIVQIFKFEPLMRISDIKFEGRVSSPHRGEKLTGNTQLWTY